MMNDYVLYVFIMLQMFYSKSVAVEVQVRAECWIVFFMIVVCSLSCCLVSINCTGKSALLLNNVVLQLTIIKDSSVFSENTFLSA